MADTANTVGETKQMPIKHDDDDFFDRKSFPYSELYGPNWEGRGFNPLWRNIQTRTVMSSSHHARLDGPRTRGHFEVASRKLKYAFCLAWVTVPRDDGSTDRVRCGENFLILSSGCGQPGHESGAQKDVGPNSIFQKLLRDEQVTWKVLNDPEADNKVEAPKDPKQLAREAAEANEIVLQAQVEETGFVDMKELSEMYAKTKIDEKVRKRTAKENKAKGVAFTQRFGPAIDEDPNLSPAEVEKKATAAARLAALDAKATQYKSKKSTKGR